MSTHSFKAGVVTGLIILLAGLSFVPGSYGEVGGQHVSTTETFYPTDDSEICKNHPEDNYGVSGQMRVRNNYGASPGWERDALVRFDLSSIPDGATVTSATLYLYYYEWMDNNPAGRNLTAHRITSDWDEETVTWNTRPDWLSEATSGSIVPVLEGQWMDWDVTKDVQDFVDGIAENFGWLVMDPVYWGWVDIPIIRFRTKEYEGFLPYLEVTYEGGGENVIDLYPPTSIVPTEGVFAINGILWNDTEMVQTWETRVVVTTPGGSTFELGPSVTHILQPGERKVIYSVADVPPDISSGSYEYTLEVYDNGFLIGSDSEPFKITDCGEGNYVTIPGGYFPTDLTGLLY